nr:MAG TPA: hypothetical protein [Caudoviricetes sp.]
MKRAERVVKGILRVWVVRKEKVRAIGETDSPCFMFLPKY